MIQFFVVLIAVAAVTAYFFGPDKAIQIGPKVLDYWLLLALAVVVLAPALSLFKWINFFRKKLFESKKSGRGV
jgi:hypothetical protein